jgi:acyl-coenzyme A thioesterase PaaI-like protein
MHGGAVASFIDTTTTLAIYAFDQKSRGQTSVKLNTDFLQAAEISH